MHLIELLFFKFYLTYARCYIYSYQINFIAFEPSLQSSKFSWTPGSGIQYIHFPSHSSSLLKFDEHTFLHLHPIIN